MMKMDRRKGQKMSMEKDKQTGVDEKTRIIVKRMISDGISAGKVARMTGLNIEVVRALMGLGYV